jgi:hypothetical protein
MSHPDPLFDAENAYDDDFELPIDDPNYDDNNDFYLSDLDDEDVNNENEEDDVWDDSYDDSMDGDFDSAMRDAGFGTDEDYGYYGEDY